MKLDKNTIIEEINMTIELINLGLSEEIKITLNVQNDLSIKHSYI